MVFDIAEHEIDFVEIGEVIDDLRAIRHDRCGLGAARKHSTEAGKQ